MRPVFWGLALAAVLFLGVYLAVHSSVLRQRAAALIEERATAALGRPVTIEALRFELVPLSVALDGVRVGGRVPDEAPLAVVSHAKVDARLYWRGGLRLELDSVRLDEPVVTLIFDPGQGSNVEGLGGGAAAGPAGPAFEIALEELTVNHGVLVIDHQRLPLDLTARGLAGRFWGTEVPQFEATVRELETTLPRARPFQGAATLRGRLDGLTLEILQGRIAGPELTVAVTGRLKFGPDRHGALEVAVETGSEFLRAVGYVDDQLAGDLTFGGTVSWDAEAWTLQGAVAAGTLRVLNYPLRRLQGVLNSDRERVELEVQAAEYAGGSLTGAVRVDIEPGRPPVVAIELELEEVDFERLLLDQGWPVAGVAGAVSGPFSYGFDWQQPDRGTGWADLVVSGRERAGVPFTGDVPLLIEDGVFSTSVARLDSEGHTIAATGAYDLDRKSGAFHFEVVTERVEQLLPLLSLGGDENDLWRPAAGNGRIDGELTVAGGETRVDLRLDLAEVRSPGAAADQLRGSLAVTAAGVGSMRLELLRAEAGLIVTGSLPFAEPGEEPEIPFALTLDAAGWPLAEARAWLPFELPVDGPAFGALRLGGSLEALEGSARFRVRPARLLEVTVDEVDADLEFDPRSVRFRELVATAPAGSVSAAGTWDPQSDALAIEVASGQLRLSRAPFAGWWSGPLEGRAELDGFIGGTLATPHLSGRFDMVGLKLGDRLLGDRGVAGLEVSWREGRVAALGSILGLVEVNGGGRLDEEALDLDLAVEAPDLPALAGLFGMLGEYEFGGSGAGRLRVSGRPAGEDPWLTRIELERLDLDYAGHRLAAGAPVRLELAPDVLVVESLYLVESATGHDVFVGGSIGLGEGGAVDLRLQSSVDPALLAPFLPGFDLSGGRFDVLAVVDGTTLAPRINGQGEVRDARLVLGDIPPLEAMQRHRALLPRPGGARRRSGPARRRRAQDQRGGGPAAGRNGAVVQPAGDGTRRDRALPGGLAAARQRGAVGGLDGAGTPDPRFGFARPGPVPAPGGGGADPAAPEPVPAPPAGGGKHRSRAHLDPDQCCGQRPGRPQGAQQRGQPAGRRRPGAAGLVGLAGAVREPRSGAGGDAADRRQRLHRRARIADLRQPLPDGAGGRPGGEDPAARLRPVAQPVGHPRPAQRQHRLRSAARRPRCAGSAHHRPASGGTGPGTGRRGLPLRPGGLGGHRAGQPAVRSGPLSHRSPHRLDRQPLVGSRHPRQAAVARRAGHLLLRPVDHRAADPAARVDRRPRPDPGGNPERRRHLRRRCALGEELLSRWAGLVLCLLAAPAAAGPPLVSAVELRGDAPFERAKDLYDLIVVAPGEPLEASAVARSLRNLQAYGSAGEIVAFTEQRPEGLAVVFGLWARIQVDEIRIEGDLGLRRAQLVGALPQRPRQPLSGSKVIRGVWALQDLYTRFGFRQRLVQVAVETNAYRTQAVVTYRVEAGSRARVGEVTFSGETGPFSAAELRGALRSETGRFHHEATAAGDVERLQEWLIGRGFRRAEVDPPLDVYDAAANRVDLEFPLRVGPRFDIVAPGVNLKRLRREDLLPFLENERFDPALLAQSRDALRRHFQERGHYDARVDLEQEETGDGITLSLAIEPGPVFKLAAVRFLGNESFAAAELAALMETSPARRLGSGGRLVDEIVEDDLDNLRSYYALEGFGEAVIGPVEVERRGASLELVVPIVEGSRRRVVNLSFEGCDRLAAVALVEGLALRPAGPYHPRLLEQSQDQIRARYEAAGMRAAQVTADLLWNEERTLVDVVFKIFEGPRSIVERIVIRGQQRTRPFIIRRATGLGRGQPLSTERLLEAQRRLYGLGVFSRVDVKLSAGTPFSAERDVVVRVEEGARRNVTYGFGYDSEDGARGLFGVGHRNLFGRAIAGRLDLRASQRETQIRALVRQPFLGNSGWPVSYSLFRIEESRDSFDSRRRGAQIEGLRLSGSDRYGLLMSYRKVQVEDADPALQDLEIERALREVEIFSVGPSLFIDRRDDPFEPRRGWSTNLVLEAAQPLGNADVELLKLFGQQTYNLDLRRFGVLAASLRLGAIEPGGGNAVDPTVEGLLSARVPISERFFAGGRSSHRAYRRDRLGIAGETALPFTDPDQPDAEERLVPVGGTGLALLNLDYRFPIWGALGGVAFVDAGNVWADWRDIDPTEAKVGAGVGLRYLSPLGPIRAEIGWNLDREPGEELWVATLSVGNPF